MSDAEFTWANSASSISPATNLTPVQEKLNTIINNSTVVFPIYLKEIWNNLFIAQIQKFIQKYSAKIIP